MLHYSSQQVSLQVPWHERGLCAQHCATHLIMLTSDSCTVRYTETHQALEEAAAAAAELAAQATGHANKSAPFLSAPCSQRVPQELVLLHCTALHLAAIYGHAATVQALLASPACSPAACNAMVSAI